VRGSGGESVKEDLKKIQCQAQRFSKYCKKDKVTFEYEVSSR
jgi:hypothetical protein